MRRGLAALLVATLCVAVAAGCGSSGSVADGASGRGFPMKIRNCDTSVTLDASPKRVVLLNSASVPYLHALGALDRVVAKAGLYQAGYYDAATRKELDAIPSLTQKVDERGHLQLSREAVVAQRPDLVLDATENLTRPTLSAVDVPLFVQPAFCDQGAPDRLGFGDVYEEMRLYGRLFDRTDEADRAVAGLRQRTDRARFQAAQVGRGRTAAVLYPEEGGTVEAYGSKSMTNALVRAAGFTNVFGDVDQRVFEISGEQLVAKDPDVLILLYNHGDPTQVTQVVRDLAGADNLTAVRNDDLMPLLFNFAEPPTPLSVDGLEKIVARFGEQ